MIVKKIRQALKESQRVFAKRFNVDQSLISGWETESNVRKPKISTAKILIAIANEAKLRINKDNEIVKNTRNVKGLKKITLESIYD